MIKYDKKIVDQLNKDIREKFHHITEITPDMKNSYTGVSRMVMLERYAQKDVTLSTLKEGDFVVATIRDDVKFPTLGTGIVKHISQKYVEVQVDNDYIPQIDPEIEQKSPGCIEILKHFVSKPLEIYYEQIARRIGNALARNEHPMWKEKFYEQIRNLNIVPAGRVIYGAGSNSQVTFFNCFVLPMIHDSKAGLAKHRQEIATIMAYGGGVGTNGSTLRPRNAFVEGTNGKSSGSVSWLNDMASLTDLIQQGGSRRGAQMIMLQVWHPDIIEFIISKMQRPHILKWIIDNFEDKQILEEAKRKLRFVPLSDLDKKAYKALIKSSGPSDEMAELQKRLDSGGEYEVISPQFLSGANISVGITREFMEAIEKNRDWELKFPDFIKMDSAQKVFYNNNWQQMGDVREWEAKGYPVRTYHKLPARELWDLINFCATYSAEPGVFFLDRANEMTNAVAYDQKVVCTNPCGEQPLAPYSVCNLAAINLANFVDKSKQEILWDKLEETVRVCVRLQDNVIDETPYFMEENETQAKGERRLGMGVMGLHDMLIWLGVRYGSKKGNNIVDQVFEKIATTAYLSSSKLAEEKGSFPFLYDRQKLLSSGYLKKMPSTVRKTIEKNGLRNSHLLTIAPTGTTGTMIGVSTGLEPYFSFKYFRTGRLGKFMEVEQQIVQEWREFHKYTKQELPDFFNTAMELAPDEHVDVQTTIQRWVDSSISKTVNAPKGYSVKQVEKIYLKLYKDGAKGGTVYVDGSRTEQVLNLTKDKDEEQPEVFVSDATQQKIERIQERMADVPGLVGNKEIGTEIGNMCPVCKLGTVEELGGCNTCSNCSVQLVCGL